MYVKLLSDNADSSGAEQCDVLTLFALVCTVFYSFVSMNKTS